ncbi:MAG TPA: ABC transporter permease [Candidatus Krumholzibacteria bacterium]|nr:ABC transporter permease [Candidatus Krumholzibacteria bacterium]
MRLRDLAGYAGGGLRGHRLRTLLTLLGVTIGVAAVVILTSLGEGARRYVVGEFASLGSNLVILVPGKTETEGLGPLVSTAEHDLTLDDAAAVQRRVRGVRSVAPVVVGTARAEFRERGRDITVLGTSRPMLDVRQLEVRVGRYLPSETTRGPICVLGATVARELFVNRNPLGESIRVGGMRLRVVGLMAPRGQSLGMDLDEVVHVPVETAMHLFDQSSLFRVVVEARSAGGVERVQEDALALLAERHGTEDVTAITQDAVLSTFDRILGALTIALGAIAAISLTVAGIGIMNVMLVAVSERTREIGLLKALGATRRQVLTVFLLEAAVISGSGGLLGLGVGLAAATVLRLGVEGYPVQPPVWAVVAALIVSATVGVVFGLVPARRAMRLDPVDALTRHRG